MRWPRRIGGTTLSPRCVCARRGLRSARRTRVDVGAVRQGDVRERVAERQVVAIDGVDRRQPSTSSPVIAAPSTAWIGDVEHVVGEPAAVREAGEVAGQDAERVRLRRRCDRHVQPQHLRGPEGDAFATGRLRRRRSATASSDRPAAPSPGHRRRRRRPRRCPSGRSRTGRCGSPPEPEPRRSPRRASAGSGRGPASTTGAWSASRSGEIELNASLRLSGTTTSLTSGLPSRETWTNSSSGASSPATLALRRSVVLHTPMTGLRGRVAVDRQRVASAPAARRC